MLRIFLYTLLNFTICISMGAQCLDVDRNVTHPTCGMEDGMVELTPQNGTPPYLYQWDSGSEQSNGAYTVTDLALGFHAITVTDVNGCSAVKSSILVQGDFQIDAFTQLTACQGGCAQMFVAAGGGCQPYSYVWSGPNGYTATGSTPLACYSGTYSVTGTDCNGCQSVISNITVSSTSSTFDIDVVNVDNATCTGGCDGAIDITINGGNPPYIFNWSDGESTEDLSGLCEGTYQVTVADENGLGCYKVMSIDVLNNAGNFTADIIDVQPPSCENCEGAIDISLNGGTAPFDFIWSNGATTEDITGLCTGDYMATVTDADGCVVELTIPVENDAQNPFNISLFDLEICEGECFSAEPDIQGAANGLTFEWIDPSGNAFANTQNVIICESGTYTVNAMNPDGCIESATMNLTLIPALILGVALVEPESSAGNCDGSIYLDINGGLPPYFFEWEPTGDLEQDIVGICAGTYSVFVTDVVGCIAELTINVPVGGLELSSSIEQPECPQECFSEAAIIATGGLEPYTYLWSNGQNQAIVSNLCPGIYNVTVVDAVGATGVIDVVMEAINPLSFEAITTSASCSEGGSLTFNVLEGSGVYNYFINGGQVGVNSATNLSPGNLIASVTDLTSGCTVEQIITIGQPFDVLLSATAASCDVADGTATATIPGGTSTYSYLWSNGDTNATATGLSTGGYSVTVTDDVNGCASHENIIIEEAEGCFVTISGYVIVDNDQDCIPGVDADSIPHILISLDETEYTYTDENGYFEFQTESGTHTLYYLTESALYEPLCIAPIDVTIPNFGDVSEGNNFFVNENDITDLKLHISKTPIRPGFNHYVTSNVFNYGNQIINGTYTLVHDANQTFIVSQPPATNYDATTRTITWDYNNLDPLENFVFLSQFNTPSTTSLGTEIAVTGTVDPLIGDFNTDNNTATCVSEVVGSYDPNDKLVMHDGDVLDSNPEIVWHGSTNQITYRIRFQNTGTDTAFTVVIEDELDELIDIRNITPGPSSHSYNLDVRDDNTLVFTFDNILLPDSTTNEPASHGYVFFDVDVTDIGLGEDVLNDAAIFFDYNSPIITNEVTTIFDFWFAVENLAALNNIQLSPNPAQHFTSLFYELNEDVNVEIDLLDITGKLVQKIQGSQRKPVGHHNIQINTYSLENGTYLLRMNIDNQLITRKLVIIK